MDALLAVTLKVPISYQAGEELAVGLILSDGKQVKFRLSEFKLSIAGKLLSADAMRLLKDKLGMVQREYASLVDPQQLGFDASHSLLSAHYLDYLSRYSNNSLRFDIEHVSLPFSQESFDLLYRKFVTTKVDQATPKTSRTERSKVKAYLKPKISTNVTWDAVIRQDQLKGLIFPEVKFDFAGVNGGLVLGHIQDFSKEYHAVCNDLATLFTVSQVKKGLTKSFMMAKEPSPTLSRQHKLWTEFQSVKEITYIDIDTRLDDVAAYLAEHDVKPLGEVA